MRIPKIILSMALLTNYRWLSIAAPPSGDANLLSTFRNVPEGGETVHQKGGHHKHKNKHRHHHGRRRTYSKDAPILLSPRVMLASAKPELPPFALADIIKSTHDISYGQGPYGNGKMGRQRRDAASSSSFVAVPVCSATSQWVERHHAKDMYGNNVTILQEIEVGGVRINQYFYETQCSNENATCTGIDTSNYYSACQTKHVWVYAFVQTATDQGWYLVQIPGSCNCGLFRKPAGDTSALRRFLETLRGR